jgi:hypothetical protein
LKWGCLRFRLRSGKWARIREFIRLSKWKFLFFLFKIFLVSLLVFLIYLIRYESIWLNRGQVAWTNRFFRFDWIVLWFSFTQLQSWWSIHLSIRLIIWEFLSISESKRLLLISRIIDGVSPFAALFCCSPAIAWISVFNGAIQLRISHSNILSGLIMPVFDWVPILWPLLPGVCKICWVLSFFLLNHLWPSYRLCVACWSRIFRNVRRIWINTTRRIIHKIIHLGRLKSIPLLFERHLLNWALADIRWLKSISRLFKFCILFKALFWVSLHHACSSAGMIIFHQKVLDILIILRRFLKFESRLLFYSGFLLTSFEIFDNRLW